MTKPRSVTELNSKSESDSSASIPDNSSSTQTETDEERSSLYQENETIFSLHNQQIYPAKILKIEKVSKGWRLYVHYIGWNKNWDEWVGEDRLMKKNVENSEKFLKLQQDLKAAAGRGLHIKLKSPGAARSQKRKREADALSKENAILPLEKLVNFQIPAMLKKQLLDDWELITNQGKFVKLPRDPNVEGIMNQYLGYRLKKDGQISEAVKEVTKGLCCYFNKALPMMLLYKSERDQYANATKDEVFPSTIYGAEHLLRLFVKLPELLPYANIEDETMVVLQQNFADFLKFLRKNLSTLFLSTYQALEDTETSTNRQGG